MRVEFVSGLIVGFSASVLRHMIILNSLHVTVLINSKTNPNTFDPLVDVIPGNSDRKRSQEKQRDCFGLSDKDTLAHRSIAIVYVRGPVNCITVERLNSTLNETVQSMLAKNPSPGWNKQLFFKTYIYLSLSCFFLSFSLSLSLSLSISLSISLSLSHTLSFFLSFFLSFSFSRIETSRKRHRWSRA